MYISEEFQDAICISGIRSCNFRIDQPLQPAGIKQLVDHPLLVGADCR